MKVVILNGSPRKGNTEAAIEALKKGFDADTEVEEIRIEGKKIAPCKGCGACKCTDGCVFKDDAPAIVDKVVEADAVVFATPVYFWGMTAQLKLIIDRLYSKGVLLKQCKKKVGTIVVGAAATDAVQYSIMDTQFDCIIKYFDWECAFHKDISAMDKGEVAANEELCNEMAELAVALK